MLRTLVSALLLSVAFAACGGNTFKVVECEPSHISNDVTCTCNAGYSDGGDLRAPCAPTGQGGAGGEAGMGGTGGAGAGGGGAGGTSCSSPATYYYDHDGDTYGAGTTVKTQQACEPPGIGWTLKPLAGAGDCQDDNANVNPGIKTASDAPYTDTAGKPSFDYNCDGKETPEQRLSNGPDYCTGTTTCKSSIPMGEASYDTSVGPGQDACGTLLTKLTCGPTGMAGACEITTTPDAEKMRCL